MIEIAFDAVRPVATDYYALAAGDHKYFEKFAPALVESAERCNQPIHLGCVNPTPQTLDLIYKIFDAYGVNTTVMTVDLRRYSAEQKRVFYACARTHLAAHLMPASMFVIDIDSVFQREFLFHPADRPIGLYLRDAVAAGARTMTEMRGMRCLGCYYVKAMAEEYMREVSAFMQREDHGYWFVDQIALIEVAIDMDVGITDLSTRSVLDCTDFTTDSVLYSGKGHRKYDNQTYLARFGELDAAARSRLDADRG